MDADTVDAILAPDLDGLEARLTRNGYNVKLLTEMIAARPKDIRSFLSGRLPPERTQELHDQLLAAGVPLLAVLNQSDAYRAVLTPGTP